MTLLDDIKSARKVSPASLWVSWCRAAALPILDSPRDRAHLHPHAVKLAKAATTSNDLSGLTEFQVTQEGLLERLRLAGIFDPMLPAMRSLPRRSRTAALVLGAQGDSPEELEWKRIDSLSFDFATLKPLKSSAIVVLSSEIMRDFSPMVTMLLERELIGAVAAVTDQRFISGITADVNPQSSAGSDAVAVHKDAATLLDAVDIGSTSRPHFIMSAAVAKALATMPTTTGATAFPGMSATGGTLLGLPALVTDAQIPESPPVSDFLALVDADGLGADPGAAVPSSARHADIKFSATGSETVGQSLVSLWQSDSVALRIERTFAFQKLRANCVAWLPASYEAGSP